ncbi:hypothetical protein NUU61_006136 [Penicillium alfredii]|uniref:Ubiquitin-like domain-containing protein n=1 Tax=Penicillium alfredii TaxID=1506179 RepID=A0A9W9F0J7_9EURO|nr:uncharacterized protein NUU61_006136 [Penicillium alfredii]KAJ5091266.1 hypothetical protein NUU61_006136 [Penicillium alfredii]
MTTDAPAAMDANESLRMITLHVLCPSLPSPNRFTFRDLSLSATIGQLKDKIAQSIPGRPTPENQRLIYSGRRLPNDDATLQEVFEPAEASEYSLHLVLPPVPAPTVSSASVSNMSTLTNQNLFGQRNSFQSSTGAAPSTLAQAAEGIRYRGQATSTRTNSTAQRSFPESLQHLLNERPTFGHPHNETNSSRRINTGASHENLGTTSLLSSHNNTQTAAPSTTSFGSTMTSVPSFSSLGYSTFPARPPTPSDEREILNTALWQIVDFENDLHRGAMPLIERVIHIRTQLLELQDRRVRTRSRTSGEVESLLSRILNIYQRADQIQTQTAQMPSLNFNRLSERSNFYSPPHPLFMVTSPNGYQGLVTPPNTQNYVPSSVSVPSPAVQQPQAVPLDGTTPGPAAAPEAPANPNAAAIENAVRRAALNQPRRNNNNNNNAEQPGLAHHMRRIWLFVRLYFFCYMISEPGTWTRIFFVSLSLLAALFSDTDVPQQLLSTIVGPVQRHLENLVQPAQQPAPAAADPNAGGPANELWTQLRRVERWLVLLLASLVPGIGERQVEARNAAEAAQNAERARQEEQARERDDQAANAANDANAPPQPDPSTNQPPPEQAGLPERAH